MTNNKELVERAERFLSACPNKYTNALIQDLLAALQPQLVNMELLEACDIALKALLNPNPRDGDGWRIPADNAIYVLGKAIASAESKPVTISSDNSKVNVKLIDALERISVLDYNDHSELLDAVKIAKQALEEV